MKYVCEHGNSYVCKECGLVQEFKKDPEGSEHLAVEPIIPPQDKVSDLATTDSGNLTERDQSAQRNK